MRLLMAGCPIAGRCENAPAGRAESGSALLFALLDQPAHPGELDQVFGTDRLRGRHASHVRQCVANAALASSSVAENPCDGTRGMTTAPVIVHIQGRSCGALALRKMRPIARSPDITS
jgi:hypothetical protein